MTWVFDVSADDLSSLHRRRWSPAAAL